MGLRNVCESLHLLRLRALRSIEGGAAAIADDADKPGQRDVRTRLLYAKFRNKDLGMSARRDSASIRVPGQRETPAACRKEEFEDDWIDGRGVPVLVADYCSAT